MGLFGNDKEQDARIDALEAHVRAMTEAVQMNQLDVAALHILMLGVQAQVDEKLSKDAVDPSIVALNEQLAVARQEYDKMSTAAADSWSTLHAGATEAVSTLRSSVEEAADRIEKELSD